jgi:hypothetical protein
MVDVDGIESVALPLTSSVLAAYVFPLEQLEQILKNLHFFFTFYCRGIKTHSSISIYIYIYIYTNIKRERGRQIQRITAIDP